MQKTAQPFKSLLFLFITLCFTLQFRFCINEGLPPGQVLLVLNS